MRLRFGHGPALCEFKALLMPIGALAVIAKGG